MEFIPLSDAAARLEVPESTLRYWRQNGTGPAHYKVGRRLLYRIEDLDAFMDSCRTEAKS